MRSGAGDAELATAVDAIWRRRADRYSEIRTAATPREPKVEMSYIGG
jgi:cyclic pyranopterin phosphate synthase